jgi:hypothetical protein
MSKAPEWRCRNFHCGSFIKYATPDENHLATLIEERGPVYVFADVEQCRELNALWYADEPIAIGDIRAFIDVSQALRTTIRAAEQNDGKWERES